MEGERERVWDRREGRSGGGICGQNGNEGGRGEGREGVEDKDRGEIRRWRRAGIEGRRKVEEKKSGTQKGGSRVSERGL